MMGMLIISLIVFFGLMLWIGWYSQRKTSLNSEDYYMGNRGFNTFVVFCTILGTNMSAFVMLGAAGLVYRGGIGMYAFAIGGAIFGMAFFNWIFGARLWALGKRFKYITPTDYVESRFNSPVLTTLVFIVFVIYTLPYITIGQIGAGAAFANFTNGAIPFWAGSLIVTLIVGYYVWGGGMRGTALTNVAQVIIFLSFLIVALVWIGIKAGGPSSILNQVRAIDPNLLNFSNPAITWQGVFSYAVLYSINIFAMPHVYIRFMVAKNPAVLRRTATLYPIGVLLTWIPACILGFWGIALIPGLEGLVSDNIVFLLSKEFLPVWMFAIAIIALLAIVMSTMDAQTLTISSLFTNAIMKARFNIDNPIRWGRGFIILILAVSYFISLIQPSTVFQLSVASFTGTASLIPVLVGGMYWKRLNKQGAIASVLTGLVLVPAYFATTFFPKSKAAENLVSSLPTFQFQPIIPVIVCTFLVLIVVTLLTPKQNNLEADEQFTFLDSIYKNKSGSKKSDDISGKQII